MASPVTRNDKRFSCWICKHFQPLLQQGEPYDGSGECRALPPAACCSIDGGEGPTKEEPVYPRIHYAIDTWCSTWMQRRAEEDLGTIPGRG